MFSIPPPPDKIKRKHVYTAYTFVATYLDKRPFIGKIHSISMDICAEKKNSSAQCKQSGAVGVSSGYSLPHCLPVKKRRVVVARNTLPACSTVLGNSGKLGEQG